MMDTILNLGLNDQTVEGMAQLTGNPSFARDAYRRFIMMYSDVVLELKKADFEKRLEAAKEAQGVKEDRELSDQSLKKLVEEYKQLVKERTGKDFPTDPFQQLFLAVEAVFRSWNNPRAIVYRNQEHIPHDLGTAVNIQTMVFGNMGDDCGTGVAFTRNASTGEKALNGDILFNAQGEDVVAGIRNPLKLEELKKRFPDIYRQFDGIAKQLEAHYRDLQDMEFTIEKGRLFMLQTRSAKRTAQAAIKVAVDMVFENLITKEEALQRVTPAHIDQMLHPYFKPESKAQATEGGRLMAVGVPASPGAATGHVVFSSEAAVAAKKADQKVILVRQETTPDDAAGMLAAEGILTSKGGTTSHAALVARGWGIPCVVGCEALQIDPEARLFKAKDKIIREHERISIDGSTGEVIIGVVERIIPEELDRNARQILAWANDVRRLQVWANADNPRDAERARVFGAEGIGLCRTEHMFMETDRLPIVREMILAGTREARDVALEQLEPIQQGDFYGILKAMAGLPVTIRLLDPPLHEFLPDLEELLVEVTTLRVANGDPEELARKEAMLAKVKELHEFNPMLGLRVCRLGIVYPEIYRMQVRAIFKAACQLVVEGVDVRPEVMIPGVGHINEMIYMRKLVMEEAEKVMEQRKVRVPHHIGTMVELPRACVVADQLAQYADFFSFGTNDLTQTTFGYSRDDAAGSFIPVYIEKGILPNDPFQTLDRTGVGRLMRVAVTAGRETNKEIKIGICGEHGGDPASVEFCHIIGLNYVSCSPYRVPIARLAAAQAVLGAQEGTK